MSASPALRSVISIGTTVMALFVTIAALPWLRGESPAETILRIRFTARGRDDAAVEQLRQQLGLPADPVSGIADWLSRSTRGDLGSSWVSGEPVTDRVLPALQISMTLAVAALLVATLMTALVLARPLVRLAGTGGAVGPRLGGALAAVAALPEVVVAVVLVLALAVGVRWFPATGWGTPSNVVLPALALGLPAGGLLARLMSTVLDQAMAEPWVATWRSNGVGRRPIVMTVLRRVAAVGAPQVVVVFMTIVGSAVAVEQVFSIPGAGRLALDAVLAQDLPVLQGCLLGFLVVGLVAAGLAAAVHAVLLRPETSRTDIAGLRTPTPRATRLTAVAVAILAAMLAVGLPRDGRGTNLDDRLARPSLAHPLGADAVGHDVLGRLAHGTALTIALALVITVVALLVGLAVGLPTRHTRVGGLDVLTTIPSTIVGIVVATVTAPGLLGACIAVLAVAWIPLAIHARTLAGRARAAGYVQAATLAGTGAVRVTMTHVLPALAVPLLRHALVRTPGVALGIAALSFIGLGADPDAAELGAMLADGVGYLERAPWLVLAPGGVLVLMGLIAGTAGSRRRA